MSRVAHDDRDRLVVAPHHPDRLRRPPVSLAAPADDRFRQALTWNIFRTLELVTPSFWLRRLHLRLMGEAPPVAAQICRVRLWHHLPLPAVQRIDGQRPDIIADAVIETEHAVWTLFAETRGGELTDGEHVAAAADAGRWFAGSRLHYCAVIESSSTAPSALALLRSRYARSRDSARLRSATRGPAMPLHVEWGAVCWSGLIAVLQDCTEAGSLPSIERALARNALEWLAGVEVDAAAAGVTPRSFQAERRISS